LLRGEKGTARKGGEVVLKALSNPERRRTIEENNKTKEEGRVKRGGGGGAGRKGGERRRRASSMRKGIALLRSGEYQYLQS